MNLELGHVCASRSEADATILKGLSFFCRADCTHMKAEVAVALSGTLLYISPKILVAVSGS